MLTNYHMHTDFCDGKNTVEELTKTAIEKGFSAIGFSGHGYTEYDLRYCMQDTAGYISEVNRIKEKYKGKIEVYLGVEEDSHGPVNRADFDYVIGSCHFIEIRGKLYAIDSNYQYFTTCLEAFGGDELGFAEAYFQHFCDYIKTRKPDIIGHFDLVTKFDECEKNRFLGNAQYWKIAEIYTKEALKADCIFEVNTGLMARGYRSLPCPHERLLRIIAKNGGKVTLSSDAHQAETLDYGFAETKTLLKDVGFREVCVLKKGEWTKDKL